MTPIQGPRQQTSTQGPPRRYPIPLRLGYKATSRMGPVLGFGETKMMSGRDIIFAAGDGLKPGMKAELVLAWPGILDDRILLQLVLQVTITGSQDNVAEARIRTYDFRIRRAEGSK